MKYNQVMSSFHNYFQAGETVEEYTTMLYSLVDTYNYGDLREEMVRDWVVAGIQDTAVSTQQNNSKEHQPVIANCIICWALV